MILHDDYPRGEKRDEVVSACAVVYDAYIKSVIVFGDVFPLNDLRQAVLEVRERCSESIVKYF